MNCSAAGVCLHFKTVFKGNQLSDTTWNPKYIPNNNAQKN